MTSFGSFWSSKLSSTPITSTDPLPSEIYSIFANIASNNLEQFDSLTTFTSIDLLTNHFLTQFNESLIDLIGCLIYNLIHSKHILHILSTCEIFKHEIGKSLLTDVIWFWGTQVSE
jgi:hypothetical protein